MEEGQDAEVVEEEVTGKQSHGCLHRAGPVDVNCLLDTCGVADKVLRAGFQWM